MEARLLPLAERDPASDGPCIHPSGCTCRRPTIGRAVVTSVALELIMAVVAIATGATAIGLVACGAMAGCMWVAAVAEVVAFYRVGLGENGQRPFEYPEVQDHRPEHMFG